MTERQELGSLEAMLFAHAEPVETARLADALRLDADEVTTLLQKLQKRYDEQESGMVILYFEPDRWQMTTRPYYGEMVKRILDTRRNAPLSPAALEVLAVIAYNQPVSRSFIEQVRGVDSSSTVTKLLDKGLIEEAGRLDLPGKPVAFQVLSLIHISRNLAPSISRLRGQSAASMTGWMSSSAQARRAVVTMSQSFSLPKLYTPPGSSMAWVSRSTASRT